MMDAISIWLMAQLPLGILVGKLLARLNSLPADTPHRNASASCGAGVEWTRARTAPVDPVDVFPSAHEVM